MERAQLAFVDSAYDTEIISTIARLASREDGDARKAIALLLKAAEIAEQRDASFIDADHVLVARDSLEIDATENFLKTLPDQFKIVIIGISNSQAYNKCAVNTGSLLGIYHELTRHADDSISSIGDRRLLQILKELRDHGVIDLHVISNGRHGRYSVASSIIERKVVEAIFSKDPILRKLLNYVPKTRCLDTFFQ
jgi:cell division control protein 6